MRDEFLLVMGLGIALGLITGVSIGRGSRSWIGFVPLATILFWFSINLGLFPLALVVIVISAMTGYWIA